MILFKIITEILLLVFREKATHFIISIDYHCPLSTKFSTFALKIIWNANAVRGWILITSI